MPIKIIPDDEDEIRAVVNTYAADLSEQARHDLIGAAKCESGYNQFDDDGNPLYSGYGTPDVGAMQINVVHLGDAQQQGLDVVNKVADNVRFGIELYRTEGMAPWKSSRICWNKPVPGW